MQAAFDLQIKKELIFFRINLIHLNDGAGDAEKVEMKSYKRKSYEGMLFMHIKSRFNIFCSTAAATFNGLNIFSTDHKGIYVY